MSAAPLHKALGVDFDTPTTAQKHELGAVVNANDGRKYKYVKASGAGVAVGDAVILSTGNVATTTSAASQPVHGVCHVAIGANLYGWVVVHGVVNVKAATVASGASLVTTATGGTLDDTAAAAGNALGAASGLGVWSLGTDAGGIASVMLY